MKYARHNGCHGNDGSLDAPGNCKKDVLTGGNERTKRIPMGMSHPAGKLCMAMSLQTIGAEELATYSFIQVAAGLSQSTIWS